MAFFAKFRRFPEFHAFIASIAALSKAEVTIADSHARAFSEEFRRYAQSQKESFSESLASLADAGSSQAQIERDAIAATRSLPQDLQPLLAQEADIAKWRELFQNLNDTALKSRAAADRADVALQRASGGGRAKAEQALSAARRKAETDESSAADQKAALERREEPFRRGFLESFVTPIATTIDARYKSAERLLELSEKFATAAQGLVEFEDPTIERFRTKLEALEQIVVE
jgi:hypothetical protein